MGSPSTWQLDRKMVWTYFRMCTAFQLWWNLESSTVFLWMSLSTQCCEPKPLPRCWGMFSAGPRQSVFQGLFFATSAMKTEKKHRLHVGYLGEQKFDGKWPYRHILHPQIVLAYQMWQWPFECNMKRKSTELFVISATVSRQFDVNSGAREQLSLSGLRR